LNTITSLASDDGRNISDHIEKAAMLWNEYRNRLGQSVNTIMHFDLQNLVHQHNLQQIEVPFSKEDIDKVVMRMPTDKAPGPDGFNGLFMKKCWNIIKENVYQLCFDFFDGKIDLQAINSSFITLVPKVNNPSTVNDFRAISLMNNILKIITKLLGDRLPLVQKNQYGFTKTRTIQDCLGWAFEYIHQYQQSKKDIVIIKLDFTKAFDMIEHSAIKLMMQQMGFNEKWISWTSSILGSASTSVLLNGVPGKNLVCKRDVRQGDPMSPSHFVMVVDLLQCIINKAHELGLLQLPIPSNDRVGFPVIQYADDTIILLQASQK
jgi:hypothetical protein